MTHDLETLMHWLKGFLIVAAICTTLFPLVWAFSPWWSTAVGRLVMLQSVAFALAIDATLYFQVVEIDMDHILTIFWVQAVIFGLIALASVSLTYTVIRMNYFSRKEERTNG